MESIVYKFSDWIDPVVLARRISNRNDVILLLSAMPEHKRSRFSFLCAHPFISFRSFDSICEIATAKGASYVFGNPWEVIDSLLRRCEIEYDNELPFPAGGAFGYFGYDLKKFLERKAQTNAVRDVPLPDCCLNFYDSFLVFDHVKNEIFIVSTGIEQDGSRDKRKADSRVELWKRFIHQSIIDDVDSKCNIHHCFYERFLEFDENDGFETFSLDSKYFQSNVKSNFTKNQFIRTIEKAKDYIFRGDIYQVNLSQRFEARGDGIQPFELFENLLIESPSPFAAFMNFGDFQIVSASPELFLKMDEERIITCPIKGTRPRFSHPDYDKEMLFELQNSEKEKAELVMITDLLRNDLGKVCEFGSVKTSEMLKIEKHPTVFHMVSTVKGRLKRELTHLGALSSCFPGGSITGAPKIRAMQIIDELEPTARVIYTGAHGYMGFNRRSQLSITIRTAVCAKNRIWYQAGAGIVADSNPEAEYDETVAKAVAFFNALNLRKRRDVTLTPLFSNNI